MLCFAMALLASAHGCDQGDASVLKPYQQQLLRDYPDGQSALGHVCWDTVQGAVDRKAQALFILGVKALSNFQYDFCRVIFDDLLASSPDFVLAYWGRAMCNAQLIWSAEMPLDSSALLSHGQRLPGFASLDAVSAGLFSAAVALNTWNTTYAACPSTHDPSSDEGLMLTRPCRYRAMYDVVIGANASFPQNDLVGAYVILTSLAMATQPTFCMSTAPGACPYLEGAQAQASAMFARGATDPGFLHYGLHAHDYPYEAVYSSGLPFAVSYPSLANVTCHSLHMPSHLWDRAGVFSSGRHSNAVSVLAADTFASADLGALSSVGGDVGSDEWNPGVVTSGRGFAFDAGNLYHSLEYQAYEELQLCNLAAASSLTTRMGVAAFQALSAGGGATYDGATFAGAWFSATTYAQWLYRMVARNALVATFHRFLGGVLAPEAQQSDAAHALSALLPYPLPWSGRTDYSHAFYSPQSEVGLWAALAISHALSDTYTPPSGASSGAPSDLANVSCGGELPSMPRCEQTIEHFALSRIDEAITLYNGSAGSYYERDLSHSTRAQVQAAFAWANGDADGALSLAAVAREWEVAALARLLPTSTSLWFTTGTEFDGILSLKAADAERHATRKLELYARANASFALCLSPQGRPHLTSCTIGAARAAAGLGDRALAQQHYLALLHSWNDSATARTTCAPAYDEAAASVAPGTVSPPPSAPASSPSSQMSTEQVAALAAGIAGATAGLVCFVLGYLLGARRGHTSASETTQPMFIAQVPSDKAQPIITQRQEPGLGGNL